MEVMGDEFHDFIGFAVKLISSSNVLQVNLEYILQAKCKPTPKREEMGLTSQC